MKKYVRILALLMTALMLLSAVGCGGKATSSDSTDTVSDTSDEGLLLDFDDDTVSGSQSGTQSSADKNQSSGGKTSSTTGGANTGTASTGGTTASKVEMSGNDPFANIPKKLKGTTVVFAHFGDEGATEYEKVLKAFTKKTGIKYKLVSYNQEQYVASVSKQIAAKSGPDVIICNDVFPAALEIAQPLQNIIDLKDDFWDDEITKLCTVGGNTYFVNSLEGVWENVNMVFYNKKLFADNGITSPLDYYDSGKWTYENLKKCAESIKKLGYVGGYVDADALNTALGSPTIDYDSNTGTFKANTAKAISAGWQLRATFFKEGLWSATDWWGTFGNGNIGLYVSGLYGAKYNGFFKDMDDSSLGAVPMPTSYNGKSLKPTGSIRAYGIATGAKNPEGAAYLLRYYLDYSYYSAAGANTFKNKSLEKMYFEKVVPEIKKKGRSFNFTGELLTNVGGVDFSEVGRADPSQVEALIAKQQNIINNAATKANEKIAKYK